MTEQKKKAKELIEKYKKLIDDNDLHCALGSEQDFAILCVDEIIELRKGYFDCVKPKQDESFWQEVKQEIINYKN